MTGSALKACAFYFGIIYIVVNFDFYLYILFVFSERNDV